MPRSKRLTQLAKSLRGIGRRRGTGILCLGVLLGALSGCATPPKVWIDANAVPQDAVVVAGIDTPRSTQPSSSGAKTYTLPDSKPEFIRGSRAESLAREAQARLRQNRATALEQLRTDLLRVARAQAARDARARREDAAQQWVAERDEVIAGILTLFEDYAKRRGDLLLDLSGRVGFPDTGRPPRTRGMLEEQIPLEEARVARLRQELRDLDQEFDAQSKGALAALAKRHSDADAALTQEAKQALARAEAQAESDARAAVNDALGNLDEGFSSLIRDLPGLPGLSASHGAPRTSGQNLDLPGGTRAKWSREELQRSAKLFAESRGWVLSETPAGAQNKTKEFIAWIKQYEVGN